MPNKKTTKITQRFFDLETISKLQSATEKRIDNPSDYSLRMDLMLAFSLLKDCFKAGFVERIDE